MAFIQHLNVKGQCSGSIFNWTLGQPPSSQLLLCVHILSLTCVCWQHEFLSEPPLSIFPVTAATFCLWKEAYEHYMMVWFRLYIHTQSHTYTHTSLHVLLTWPGLWCCQSASGTDGRSELNLDQRIFNSRKSEKYSFSGSVLQVLNQKHVPSQLVNKKCWMFCPQHWRMQTANIKI